ncbi:conserved hypothetical protein [Paecilomyces variotii No. 5]|uniref:Phosphatidylglycerol lysyltransferase C-terminal domain-containing protein n=1 Tax=Byssochlamys spectabilis (strain No. 5 / NBRC 109023) TaxID=1356009 RepID=V5I568_BYSSN|nr:conserved hypothetical protein [Paecilomyces variotii No. 5]
MEIQPPAIQIRDLVATQLHNEAPLKPESDDNKTALFQKKQKKRKHHQHHSVSSLEKPRRHEKLFEVIGWSMAEQLRNFPNIVALDSICETTHSIEYRPLDTSSLTFFSTSSKTLVGEHPTFPSSGYTSSKESVCKSNVPDMSVQPRGAAPYRHALSKCPDAGTVLTIDEFATIPALESLLVRYGSVSHMGILDKSYRFFINGTRTAALYFKVQGHVAIVGGDPLCESTQYGALLAEFARYRKHFRWKLAFMGATDSFAQYAKAKGWTILEFGTERVLNPLTNSILFEKRGKRILTQVRKLLSEAKTGITLGVYAPSQGEDPELQRELNDLYDTWRRERNRTDAVQAFITVYEVFSLPRFMVYIYSRGPDGRILGFAALRKIGADRGYHIDPCIAAKDSPKGITDLLVFSTMALLNQAGISFLSLGYEPLSEIGSISGMPRVLVDITKSVYRHIFHHLHMEGKKKYHDKWQPDENQGSNLYLIFPSSIPGPRHITAILHMANIRIRKVVFSHSRSKEMNETKKI